MKKIVMTLASVAVVFALNGCNDVKMVEVQKEMVDTAKKQQMQNSGNVYFPEHGIVCDKKSGFCADREGISMGYTKEYLGQAAQDKMMGYIQRDNMETGSYTMSNGIYCDSALKACYNNKWKERIDSYYTNMLFR